MGGAKLNTESTTLATLYGNGDEAFGHNVPSRKIGRD
jgi:hypothetical protein